LLAQCQGVDIYSPISQDELTGVIMHQASYEWGQVMTTQVPEADMTEYEASGKPLRVNNEQTEGLWVDADIAHLYRDTDSTAMDTAADVGGEAGTTVYAPVTGQVIAVESYDLYDETPDIRIHIRPDANPNLDVVLLHQTDPTVQAGDRVEAGITPVSSVRDIAAELTDLQLAYYTQTAGNHSHVQVNDLTNPDYIAKYNLQVD
ncbi:MAG: M23 family metallopeptidase, partial [Coriobacteriaceae bacterium]|nr:M23 family metallopeptidase [Coriobacteriaceae bacterium]